MNTRDVVYMIAIILLVIGGINWGLVGLFNFNLVAFLFGFMPLLTSLIYILVAASAVCVAIFFFADRAKNIKNLML
jgi:uncharacterized membrane protein YuzA (DUF378 family)